MDLERTSHIVTELLTRAGRGDETAAEALLPQVYDALLTLARRQMASEPAGHTLQATALVSEAYLRLVGDGEHAHGWNGKGHFYGAAALAMRRILVERARRVGRQKHGGGRQRVQLDQAQIAVGQSDAQHTDVLALDEALDALQAHDERAARIIMLRYFAGLSSEETAAALDLSERTVRRDWTYARLWLYEHMTGDGEQEKPDA